MKSVLALLATAAVAIAQAVGPLAINNFPYEGVEAGKSYTITYTAPDQTAPVTFILKNGAAGDLQEVKTLTTSAVGGSYVWSVDSTLPNGDYAVQIVQGASVNYMGLFPLVGGSTAAPTTAATTTATSSGSVSVNSVTTSTSTSTAATTTTNAPVSAKNVTVASNTGTVSVGTVRPQSVSSTAAPTSTGTSEPAPFDGAAAGLSVSLSGVVAAVAFIGAAVAFA